MRIPRSVGSAPLVVLICLGATITGPMDAHGQLGNACEVADNGSGTVTIPPEGCAYRNPQEVYMIIDGLPPGTTLELASNHGGFFCRSPLGSGPCLVEPGGGLGGEREVFDSYMTFEMRGTGDLAGHRRVVTFEVAMETHSAPRTPGDPVQAFDTEMFSMLGALPPGDPDFASLTLTAGRAAALPASFGHTLLTDLGDGNFHVERFFDISYRIDFVGAPGGALDGLSGSTERTTRIEARSLRPNNRCIADDDGTGTGTLPPPGCGYLTPQQPHHIINGLPPGTTIELEAFYTDFVCTGAGGICGQPGGNLGGQRETFDTTLQLHLAGTGSLDDFRRTLRVPVTVVTDSAPRVPGNPVQSFVTDLFNLSGNLTGDPDFADLTIVAGSGNGLPSAGRTQLSDLGDGTFEVDSFFDVRYQIDFVGAPGGALDGLSGSTQGTSRLEARRGRSDAVERDTGAGTVTLPPPDSQYVSPEHPFEIIDGLPPGGTIELFPNHHLFVCGTPPCGQAGGGLGGNLEQYDATLDLVLNGMGPFAGYRRSIALPVAVETHSGPLVPGASVQAFDTDLVDLQGQLLGDPDFTELTLTAGTANGLPSPGYTTLTDQADGTFLVDSFFDIDYQIDFIGAPGGAFDGLSGTTGGTVRIWAAHDPGAVRQEITIVQEVVPVPDPTDFDFTGDLGAFSLDDDADPTLPDGLRFDNLSPGALEVTQTTPADWLLLDIVCADPDAGTTVDVAMGAAMIDLDAAESITCTFSNRSRMVFADGFESGNTSVWSSTVP